MTLSGIQVTQRKKFWSKENVMDFAYFTPKIGNQPYIIRAASLCGQDWWCQNYPPFEICINNKRKLNVKDNELNYQNVFLNIVRNVL